MGAALASRLFPKPEQADLKALFTKRWAENDKRAYRASLSALVGWDVESHIPEVRCPVLVVASDQDYFPLEEKQAYVNKIPNARLEVIEDARHAVTAEKPEELNAVINKFLYLVNQ
jgi:pimeloyl-ACP methyl ester carboxylesterase